MRMTRVPTLLLLALLTTAVSGCELVGDLIELGFWMIVIGVVFVIAILGWAWGKIRGARKP